MQVQLLLNQSATESGTQTVSRWQSKELDAAACNLCEDASLQIQSRSSSSSSILAKLLEGGADGAMISSQAQASILEKLSNSLESCSSQAGAQNFDFFLTLDVPVGA